MAVLVYIRTEKNITPSQEKNHMSILIKDTTREERERIVAGKREIRDINMDFRAHYESGIDGPEKSSCGYK